VAGRGFIDVAREHLGIMAEIVIFGFYGLAGLQVTLFHGCLKTRSSCASITYYFSFGFGNYERFIDYFNRA